MVKQSGKAFKTLKRINIKTNKNMKDENEEVTNFQDSSADKSDNSLETDKVSDETDGVEKDNCLEKEQSVDKKSEPSIEEKYIALNDSHLRLIAEFDNFRKRTLREKAELIKSGGANVLTNILPVVDDFERALSTLQTSEELSPAVEGIKLIYDKFISYLLQQGV